MKKASRFLGVFLFALALFSTLSAASAADESIFYLDDIASGCFSVVYCPEGNQKLKVGVTHLSGTLYYDYTPGTQATYVLPYGDGDYVIRLYQNVSGTSYRQIARCNVSLKLADPLSIYRVSTTEITFSANDAVGKKAAELCSGKTDDEAKAVAIHNYIAANFQYDYEFARKVNNGAVKNYTPNTTAVLEAEKGVCYDFSALYAAMCRSQGIACKIEKGTVNGVYHAWNSVYVNGKWTSLDLTHSISQKNTSAGTLADCVFVPEAA